MSPVLYGVNTGITPPHPKTYIHLDLTALVNTMILGFGGVIPRIHSIRYW